MMPHLLHIRATYDISAVARGDQSAFPSEGTSPRRWLSCRFIRKVVLPTVFRNKLRSAAYCLQGDGRAWLPLPNSRSPGRRRLRRRLSWPCPPRPHRPPCPHANGPARAGAHTNAHARADTCEPTHGPAPCAADTSKEMHGLPTQPSPAAARNQPGAGRRTPSMASASRKPGKARKRRHAPLKSTPPTHTHTTTTTHPPTHPDTSTHTRAQTRTPQIHTHTAHALARENPVLAPAGHRAFKKPGQRPAHPPAESP
jgi:hypothetical protein